ncbi:MAG: TIGR03986 family CRISPR-associated RAMP protein [Phascolarctobacterium sp.]|nr:TIGR03986 family CRISPR-associated RAMP protein [Phascolarctobacterium sp.]
MANDTDTTAQYNFIPLNSCVVPAEISGNNDKEISEKYINHVQHKGKHTGYFEISLKAKDYLLIGDGESEEGEKNPFKVNDTYYIPGSSIRGCIKNLYKIISCSAFREGEDYKNQKFYHRNMFISDNEPGKEIPKLGILVHNKIDDCYYICEYPGSKKAYGYDKDKPSVKWKKDTAQIVSDVIGEKDNCFTIYLKNVNWSEPFIITEETKSVYVNDKNRGSVNILKCMKDHPEIKYAGTENFDEYYPCFFFEEDGKVKHFGGCKRYRIQYEKGIADHVVIDDLDVVNVDFTDSIFGKKELWGSRVFFDNLQLEDNDNTKPTRNIVILGEPKATCTANYLEPNYSNRIPSYDEDVRIRGYKFYWHKSYQNNTEQKTTGKNDNVKTILHPIKPQKNFVGKIRFENLSDLEFGSLLYLFQILQEKNTGIKLGAAKNLGMGTVILQDCKIFERSEDYYKKLFEGDSWNDYSILPVGQSSSLVAQFKDYVENCENHSRSNSVFEYCKEEPLEYSQRIEILKKALRTDWEDEFGSEVWKKKTADMGFEKRKKPLLDVEKIVHDK